MQLLGVISRDMEKASTRYRLGQYLGFLESKGVRSDFIHRKSINKSVLSRVRNSDVLFNQKCLFSHSLAEKMIESSRRSIFDFDDAIYTRPGRPDSLLTRFRVLRRLKLWLTRADLVTVANDYLASYARKYSSGVVVIPMALDLEVWRPSAGTSGDKITIGWAGAPVNIPLLESLDPVLAELCRKYHNVRIAVFSGRKPELSFPFDYYPYRSGQEADFVRKLDLGLLPLDDDEFARGKSPIKAIQYLACGIPVVGQVRGATAEILSPENSRAVSSPREWLEALSRLVEAPASSLKMMGEAGRSHVEMHHDIRKVRKKLLQVLYP